MITRPLLGPRMWFKVTNGISICYKIDCYKELLFRWAMWPMGLLCFNASLKNIFFVGKTWKSSTKSISTRVNKVLIFTLWITYTSYTKLYNLDIGFNCKINMYQCVLKLNELINKYTKYFVIFENHATCTLVTLKIFFASCFYKNTIVLCYFSIIIN